MCQSGTQKTSFFSGKRRFPPFSSFPISVFNGDNVHIRDPPPNAEPGTTEKVTFRGKTFPHIVASSTLAHTNTHVLVHVSACVCREWMEGNKRCNKRPSHPRPRDWLLICTSQNLVKEFRQVKTAARKKSHFKKLFVVFSRCFEKTLSEIKVLLPVLTSFGWATRSGAIVGYEFEIFGGTGLKVFNLNSLNVKG